MPTRDSSTEPPAIRREAQIECACAVSIPWVKRRPFISMLSYLLWFAHPAIKMDLWLFVSESEIMCSWMGKYYKEILSGLSFVSPVTWGGKCFGYMSIFSAE